MKIIFLVLLFCFLPLCSCSANNDLYTYETSIITDSTAFHDSQNEDSHIAESPSINGTLYQEGTHFKIFESVDGDEFIYYIYDIDQQVVHSSKVCRTPPQITMIDDNIIKVSVQAGTGIATQMGYYYHLDKDVFSRTFSSIYDEHEGRLIYRDMYNKIIVRNIFDKSDFYYEIIMDDKAYDLSAVADPIQNVTFINYGNSIEITYLSGDNYTPTIISFSLQ